MCAEGTGGRYLECFLPNKFAMEINKKAIRKSMEFSTSSESQLPTRVTALHKRGSVGTVNRRRFCCDTAALTSLCLSTEVMF